VLFVKGTLPAALEASAGELRSCAIVGTRRASRYSLDLAETVGRVLAGSGVLVVSGLALGVDGAAHRGALSGAGSSDTASGGTVAAAATVAVLGGGHAHLHPAMHSNLADQIVAQGGALISEWPPDTAPAKHHFLRRNRIISALARCVLIVEAGERSGALSTAAHALSQGRQLLVVPGRPDDPRYTGNIGLLRDGADVFFELSDVLLPFDLIDKLPARRETSAGGRVSIPWSSPLPAIELGPLAATVRSQLGTESESSLDSLLANLSGASATGRAAAATAAELTALLTAMELAGEVEQTSNGRYRLRRMSAGVAAGSVKPATLERRE
ncbi:MAG TPA: DNA-processing protein DprA, partial [Trueperaceae bacterium]|nr:DNA-processing protein DprA [Trueperaceae bacterium]